MVCAMSELRSLEVVGEVGVALRLDEQKAKVLVVQVPLCDRHSEYAEAETFRVAATTEGVKVTVYEGDKRLFGDGPRAKRGTSPDGSGR